MSSEIHSREVFRSRVGSVLSALVLVLSASACNGGKKECRQWRLQAEVPMDTKVTTSTRATDDRATLEQAQWTTISSPDQQPALPLEWAERFPEVAYTIAFADGVAASDKPQVLTVIVADGCD